MVKENEEIKVGKKSFLNNIDLDFIQKNFSFILYLMFFLLLYIANGHRSIRTARKINKLNKEVKKLRYEYLIYKKELTEITQQSKLIEPMAKLNLKPLTVSPIILNNYFIDEKEDRFDN